MDELLSITDRVKQSVGTGAALVLGAVADGKALLVANFDDAAIAAGMSAADVMREIAPIVGGGGGGKPGMARAGGKDPSKMAEAMARASELLRSAAA
jgi:alanyl-tRNA synthetase